MKMWSWRVIILLLFCYACLATGSREKVRFVSRNFNNVLHWDPVAPVAPGANVTYRVEYWNEKNKILHVKESCEAITALSCDLTNDTLPVPDVDYRAQVSVNGLGHHGTTHRFRPIRDTTLGEPNITIYASVTTLYVNASLPLGPKGVSIGDYIRKGKSGPSEILATFTLKITHPKWAAQTKENTTGKFAINLKNNQTTFCGYVTYKTWWSGKESENASFCFKLQDIPPKSLPWIILAAVSLAAMITFTVVCACHYVGVKPKHIPQALVSNSQPVSASVLQSPDNSLVISTINAQTEKTVYATLQIKPRAPSVGVGGYSPQDVPSRLWQDHSGSSQSTGALTPTSNTSAQSSLIYSTMGVHVLPVETNPTQQLSVSAETDGMTPLHNPDDWDSNATVPLLLQTVRDQDGNLVLPLLHFDLTGSKREGPSLLSVQTLDNCSDSGCDDSTLSTPTQPYCNSHYFPSQPTVKDSEQGCETTSSVVDTCESGYTHNWMPAILIGATCKESCGNQNASYPWGWTGRNKEEEGGEEEDKGGEGSLRESLLGGWGLKFQE